VSLGDNESNYGLPLGTKAFGLMTKENGQWTVAPGPDFPSPPSLTQILGRVGVHWGPMADALAEQTRILGPAAIMSPIPELMAEARVIQKIASEKPTSCDVIADGTFTPHPVPRSIPNAAPNGGRSGILRPEDTFTGTLAEFTAALRAFVARASAANGLDPHLLDLSMKYVVQVPQACAALTPQVLSSITVDGRTAFDKLGKQYLPCLVPYPVDKTGAPRLWSSRPLRFTDSDGTFHFEVFLSGGV
jgi:hypothetical protein